MSHHTGNSAGPPVCGHCGVPHTSTQCPHGQCTICGASIFPCEHRPLPEPKYTRGEAERRLADEIRAWAIRQSEAALHSKSPGEFVTGYRSALAELIHAIDVRKGEYGATT